MARQVSSIGLQVEQKESLNNRRVSGSGILVEQKEIPNKRRVSSTGIMVETLPKGRIFALITSSSTVTGNLTVIVPIYVMPTNFMIEGTLTGNVYIQGIDSEHAFINGTLFGEIKSLGLTSYVWALAKRNDLAIGVTTSLVCYLTNTQNNFNNTIIQNILLGFGRLHGLTEGKTYFTFRVNGIAPIPNRPFATVETKGLTLTFNQSTVEVSIQNDLFTFNGKQLVY
jgi:hypothetical protein